MAGSSGSSSGGRGGAAQIAARLGIEVVGETIEGIFGLASATVSAAGEAAKGIGYAVGGALEGALSPAPVTVVNNVGMAGEAAKAKVTGGGSIPTGPKKAAKPVANVKMPTEKLLVIAVNYLSSIEKTLESQLNFERTAAAQQAQAEREAAIENTASPTSSFKSLGEKLGGLKDNATDRASALTKAVLGTGALAGFTLLGLGEMDKAELDAMKENWDKFYNQWKGVIDFMKPVFDAASWDVFLLGYFSKSAGFSLFVNNLVERLTGSPILAGTAGIATATGLGVFGGGAKAFLFNNPFGQAVLATAATFGIGEALFTSTQMSERKKVTDFLAKYHLYVAEWSEDSLVALKYNISWPERNINERGIKRSVLDSSDRRTDKYYYWHMVTEASGRGGPAVAALQWLGSADAQAWLNEFYPLRSDASAVPPAESSTPDASSTSETSSAVPDATALPPAATGSIDAILDKNPEQLSDAELRQLVEAQGRIEDPNGRTNNPGGILYGTGPLQEHQIGSVGANADSSVRIAVYDTPENGIRAAMENWRNSSYYRGKSVREGLGTWSGGNGADYARMLGSVRPGYEGTSNPQTESSVMKNLASAGWEMTKGAIEAVSNIMAAAAGKYTPTTGSQLTSFNTEMKSSSSASSSSSAASSSSAPITPPPDPKVAQLNSISTQIQTAVDLGNAKDSQTNMMTDVPAGQASLRSASPDGKLEAIDPNYPGTGGIEAYLQYYRLAA